jgi:hypothetical protein
MASTKIYVPLELTLDGFMRLQIFPPKWTQKIKKDFCHYMLTNFDIPEPMLYIMIDDTKPVPIIPINYSRNHLLLPIHSIPDKELFLEWINESYVFLTWKEANEYIFGENGENLLDYSNTDIFRLINDSDDESRTYCIAVDRSPKGGVLYEYLP